MTLTAVRTTSMGWAVSGSSSTMRFTSWSSPRWPRSRSSNSASWVSSGSSPYQSRYATSSKVTDAASSCTGYPRYSSELVSGLTFETAV